MLIGCDCNNGVDGLSCGVVGADTTLLLVLQLPPKQLLYLICVIMAVANATKLVESDIIKTISLIYLEQKKN